MTTLLRAADDASTPLLPAGFGVALDPSARLRDTVLLGGSPRRLLRLSSAAARAIDSWAAGTDPQTTAERTLARTLVAGGLAHPRPSGGPSPADVTVVIPVRDRAAALARCLAGLGPAGEVVVVDDASADPVPVAEVAGRFGAVLVRRSRGGGPAAARNTGLAVARTPFVAFVDSDCVPGPDWLARLLPHLADPAVAAVAPRIVALRTGGRWLERYEAVCSPLDLGPTPAPVIPLSRVSYVPAAALLVRRAAAGAGFDERLPVGEDVDFVWRLHRAGWTVRYEPAGAVAHDHRTTLRAWLARRIDYGSSAALLAARHPGQLSPAVISPWTAAAWILLGLGRWRASLAVTGVAAVLLRRRLAGVPDRTTLAVRLVGGGFVGGGRLLSDATLRAWLPLALPAALCSARARRLLVAAWLVPALVDRRRRRADQDPVRYAAARLLDDAAYCAGVWRGCLRHRSVDALLPRFSRSRTDAAGR